MKVSVALCTYNGAQYIQEQIMSILQQTKFVDEIVICDDNSSDDTVFILNKYKDKYPDIIKLYTFDDNVGLIKNFERCINLCSDNLIFLSDQDDIWKQDKVEKICNYFYQDKSITGVLHNLELLQEGVNDNFSMFEYLGLNDKVLNLDASSLLAYSFFVDNFVTGAAFAFKKSGPVAFTNNVNFMLHDFQLLIRMLLSGKMLVVNEILGFYRIHPNQQVGATNKLNPTLYNLQLLFFSEPNLKKLNHFEYVIKRNDAILESSQILRSVNKLLISRFIDEKQAYLNKRTKIKKKIILLEWALKKQFNTKLIDIIKI